MSAIKQNEKRIRTEKGGELRFYVFSFVSIIFAGIKAKPRAKRGKRLFKAFGVFGIFANFFNDIFLKCSEFLFPKIISNRFQIALVYLR